MPLGSTAAVLTGAEHATLTGSPMIYRDNTGAFPSGAKSATVDASGRLQDSTSGGLTGAGNFLHPTNLYADLTNATAVDVNAVRQAFALQRFEEARARYGSRYTEYLRYLGVRSSDARLQRPEFLGSSKQIIQFSEVLQTAPTASGSGGGAGGVWQFG